MKNNLLSIVTIFIVVFCSSNLHSQVLNVDREGLDNEPKKSLMFISDFSFSSDKNKDDLFDIQSKTEITNFFKNNYLLIGMFNYDLTKNGSDVLQNEGYAQVRFRDNDTRVISNESYIQYQWNETLGMDFRKLLGSNIRIKVAEKSSYDIYTGTGIFYEMEEWNYGGVRDIDLELFPDHVHQNLFRLNHYWKGAYKINENIDISGVSYFQFPMNNDLLNLRWYLDVNTNVKMTKNSSFLIHYDYTFDNYRVVPIAKYFYSLNFGIRLKW